METVDKLRELATDINSTEIISHMDVAGTFVFHAEWLDSWYKAFDAVCDGIEREIAERYMELPVDADGVPIRVGDLIEFGKKGERLEVTHFGWTSHGDPTVAYRRPNGTLDCSCIGDECRHVKPRTVEDVLEDFIAAYDEWDCNTYDDERMAGRRELFAKYADELRELVGVDA